MATNLHRIDRHNQDIQVYNRLVRDTSTPLLKRQPYYSKILHIFPQLEEVITTMSIVSISDGVG